MCKFSQEIIDKVWERCPEVDGYDPNMYKKDACGAWMKRDKYGDRENSLGWEIDHIYPESRLLELGIEKRDIDNLDNLRPLNWKNNVSKGDDYPAYTSICKAKDDSNIEESRQMLVNKETQERLSECFKGYNL